MFFQLYVVVMEKSPVFSKARALGLARALKLITRAFPGFADPIDFTAVTELISLYTVKYTIIRCSKLIGISLVSILSFVRVNKKVKWLFVSRIE